MQRDITGDGRQKRNNGRRRGGVRAYGAYERRRPLDRHLKRAGESRPVNCGPRDRGVRRDRGATRWNNAIGALRGGMPVRRAHLFTTCLARLLARESWTKRQTFDNRDDRDTGAVESVSQIDRECGSESPRSDSVPYLSRRLTASKTSTR